MKIVIPDDYQDMIGGLQCFALLQGHEVTRYRTPARDIAELAGRLAEAEVAVAIRERVEFPRALIERLPRLRLIALVGRNSRTIDYAAATEHGIRVATGLSGSPEAPAELAVALMLAARRNIASEAARQCGRSDAPLVDAPRPWTDALAQADDAGGDDGVRFCLWEQATDPLAPPLFEALSRGVPLAFACGPEGGLEGPEVDLARSRGWLVVSLGAFALRTETVAAAVLGAVQVWSGLV